MPTSASTSLFNLPIIKLISYHDARKLW